MKLIGIWIVVESVEINCGYIFVSGTICGECVFVAIFLHGRFELFIPCFCYFATVKVVEFGDCFVWPHAPARFFEKLDCAVIALSVIFEGEEFEAIFAE